MQSMPAATTHSNGHMLAVQPRGSSTTQVLPNHVTFSCACHVLELNLLCTLHALSMHGFNYAAVPKTVIFFF